LIFLTKCLKSFSSQYGYFLRIGLTHFCETFTCRNSEESNCSFCQRIADGNAGMRRSERQWT